MAKHEHSVELAGVNLAGRNHVCAFFNTIDEEHRVLGSFYKDGIDRGEKAAHIVDPENREEHLKRLAGAGIDVQKMMDTGQLEVAPWTDVYVRDHRFDQDAMLTAVEKLIQSGSAARLDQFFDCSQHRVLVEPVIAHIYVGPRRHLQLAGVHHLLHIYACPGQALQMLFPILGIHNVGSLFAPVDAILVERAEHSVLLVDGVEERADMISPGEIDPSEFY